MVVDALSRKFEDDGSLFALSLPNNSWLEEVRQEWMDNTTIRKLIQRLQTDTNPPKGYTWKKDTLRYKGHIILARKSTLKERVLKEMHSSSAAGHSGFYKTYGRAKRSFFWEGM